MSTKVFVAAIIVVAAATGIIGVAVKRKKYCAKSHY